MFKTSTNNDKKKIMQLNLKVAQQLYSKQQFIINREFWLLA